MVKKRTQREIFITTLTEMTNQGEKLISNKSLSEELGWQEDRYSRVKDELKREGAIIIGKGKGGTIGLSSPPGSKSLSVFVSYSHADAEIKTQLIKHLEPLKKLGLIDTWHDQQIKPGDEWSKEISKNLSSSDIILLLISIDFINSKYCYDIELEQALEMHQHGKAVVIPIILRQCLWQYTPFAALQALPKDGKAIKSFADIDDVLTSVAAGIRIVADDLSTK